VFRSPGVELYSLLMPRRARRRKWKRFMGGESVVSGAYHHRCASPLHLRSNSNYHSVLAHALTTSMLVLSVFSVLLHFPYIDSSFYRHLLYTSDLITFCGYHIELSLSTRTASCKTSYYSHLLLLHKEVARPSNCSLTYTHTPSIYPTTIS